VITLVDYGLGNVQAFLNVYKRLNIEARTADSAELLREATHVILPGVGHFDHAMQRLEESGMRTTLEDLALRRRVPVLGVCVGMQILARSSAEGDMPGLGWIDAQVRAFKDTEASRLLPLPHMGWNDVRPVSGGGLFSQLEADARFYFLHSFYFEGANQDSTLAETSYGRTFSSAVRQANIYGVQFHPEKSHHFGTRLLQNFATL
jgi:glutamine amidotransferase